MTSPTLYILKIQSPWISPALYIFLNTIPLNLPYIKASPISALTIINYKDFQLNVIFFFSQSCYSRRSTVTGDLVANLNPFWRKNVCQQMMKLVWLTLSFLKILKIVKKCSKHKIKLQILIKISLKYNIKMPGLKLKAKRG